MLVLKQKRPTIFELDIALLNESVENSILIATHLILKNTVL